MPDPIRWLPSSEAAERGLGRWHGVYAAVANLRSPHACHGPVRIDLRDPLNAEFPEAGVLELDRPVVQGINGRVFAADGTFLPDHTWHGRNLADIRLAGRIPRGEPLSGSCLSLASDFAHKNFVHFALDSLCRLHLFEQAGVRLDDIDHVFCPVPPSAHARRLLDRLEIPAHKFVWMREQMAVRPERLYAATFPGLRRNFPRWLPAYVKRRWPASPLASDRRLYVSRQGYRRSVSNEVAVRRILEAAGFESYDPARAADPARDFAEAAIVVGPHGSGMANIVWCRPGTRILEFIPTDHIQPYYYTLAESSELDYGCMVCRSEEERPPGARGPSWSDFHVDEDVLAATVAAITAA